jgi:DNA-binding PadR family transcriptional regulator
MAGMELGVGTVLLLALTDGPEFGLELIAGVEARSRGRIRLNRGGTYLALRKLERERLVRGWMRPTGGSGRPRRYYELTPRGIAKVEETREVLDRLLGSSHARVGAAEARRMADRVQRSGRVSGLALQVRSAARRAGIR